MGAHRFILSLLLSVGALCTGAYAQSLPQKITPDEPFPRIEAEAPFHETIAPGIEYARYHLLTSAGPIEVCVVATAPQHPYVKVETVLASDAITSRGETLSSMAHRTHAVAGISRRRRARPLEAPAQA